MKLGRTAQALAAVLLAVGLILPAKSFAQGNPFRDVPGDHWSLAAVRELADAGLIEGFPDGQFKGKKVVTRYDMAVHLAKLLARVDRIRVTGRAGVSPEDAVTVTRLTNEYKQELDLLGVKVDALEGRLGVVERTTKKLEKDLSNVRIEGLYQVETHFVDEPFDFTNYPFRFLSNPYRQFRRAGSFPGQYGNSTLDPAATRASGDTPTNRTGLQPIEHSVLLRFLGNPFALDGLNKDVETFLEIKGVINGPAENRLNYRFSDPPIAGDNLDDFATGIQDDRRVSVNKAHMSINSKRLKLRVFAEEAMTDFGGPLSLFSSQNFYGDIVDDFSPEQGVEASGDYKKLSYQGSIIKDQTLSSLDGFNRNDLSEEFEPETVSDRDAFGLRLAYFTDPEGVKNRLLFGTTYSEHVFGYEAQDDFNRAIGFDMVWEHRSEAEVDGSVQVINTVGRGDQNDWGVISDLTYARSRWDLRAKFYSFGRDWRVDLGARPWVETSTGGTNRNFRRPGGYASRVAGERLFRGQAKYEADDALLRTIDSLVFNLVYIQKWWESDPDNPQDFDGNTARKFSLQTIADLNDATHVEWKTEYIKDVLENEKGELRNTLEVDVNVFGETSVTGEIEFLDDYDREDPNGEHLSTRRGEIGVNSQVSDELFLPGYVETVKNDDRALTRTGVVNVGTEFRRNNGLDVNRVGGEAAYSLADDFGLKLYAEREEVEDLDNPERDGTFDRYALELAYNFTRALQFRYVRGFHDYDFIRADDDFIINNFAQLQYKPTEATEIVLTYGLEYEEGGFPPDSGPLVFWRTNKVLQLAAQTTF